MVSTIKFSQFSFGNVDNNTNTNVGISSPTGGINIKLSNFVTWTSLTRPGLPYTGLLGFNSTLGQYEYWNGSGWTQLAGGGAGTISPGLINQLAIYPGNGTTLAGLSTLNNSGLLTNGSGIPGWVPYTGTGAPVLATSPTLITPNLGTAKAISIAFGNGTGILDNNGNSQLLFTQTASAVNFLNIINAVTGTSPFLMAAGTDTNIILGIAGKGTGGVNIFGTSTNDNAPSGAVGEYIESIILQASGISILTGVNTDITTISLPPGDWLVWGNVAINSTSGPTASDAWINMTSMTPTDSAFQAGLNSSMGINNVLAITPRRITVPPGPSQTVYLSIVAVFSGSATAWGFIAAERRR